MARAVFALCAIVLVMFGAEAAGQSYNLGERATGQSYPLSLSAHNADCPELLDFRFIFEPGSWLRPRGEAIVRGVPMGVTRPLPAIVDLSQSAPGAYSTRVDVVCDNCQAAANCRIDRQSLIISVNAVAPAPTPSASAPTRTTPPRPRPTSAANTPAPSLGAAPVEAAPQPTPPAPVAPQPSGAAPTQPPAAADCTQQLGTAYAAAIIGFLAALGLGALAMNASNAARAASERGGGDGRLRAFLQERAEDLQEFALNCRQDLIRLLTAQLRAWRALSALGLVQPAQIGAAGEAWSRTAAGAGFGLSADGGRVVIGKGETTLRTVLERTAAAPASQNLFAPLDVSQASERLAWLRTNGFADSDPAAQDVLNEIANFFAHGGASDLVARLEEAAAECRRADAELAAAIASAAAG